MARTAGSANLKNNESDILAAFAKLAESEQEVLRRALLDGDGEYDPNDFVQALRALRSLIEFPTPPKQLITVTNLATDKLLQHLKSHPESLHDIHPRQFEELVAELLTGYGWDVELTPETKDGGYDLFAISKDIAGVTTSWVIECKKYRADRKVGVEIVRSLYTVKNEIRAANALLATTSSFTKGVNDFKASRYDLSLRDYNGIIEWIENHKASHGDAT